METSILTPTQKYAAAALFSLALHQSQVHQTRPSNSLKPLNEEAIEGVITFSDKFSVSDNPHLWIHENSGLLLPILRLLGVDDQAWDGLKETAGSSSQVRHHIGAFLKLLSEESEGTCSERSDREIALTNTVNATALTLENSTASPEETENHQTTQNGSSEKAIEERKLLSYQRKVTVLYELLSACIIDNDDELGEQKDFKQKKGYDARHRVALRLLATWLNVEWTEMEAMEIMAAFSLMDLVRKEGAEEDKKVIAESTLDKVKRGGVVAAAALSGGTVMALTGALAAPAIAGGLGALAPTLGSAFAAGASAIGSFAGSVAVAASFGAAGAGLTGTKMARRVGSLDEFEFNQIGENRNEGRLAVAILISGLVFKDEDFVVPWEGQITNLERYALRWESNNLSALSTAIRDWLASRIAMQLMTEGAMLTALSGLLTALAFPAALLAATDVIDSKWAIAIDRSDKAGKLLAEVLLKGLQGNRPVTLIGFSLGARVIFKCLQCLAETQGDNGGIVERVVLLGAPISINNEKWEDVRKMVSGRLINAYSTNDWTLGIAFRANLLSQGLAGIQPVDIPGIENVDVTEYIESHASYVCKTKEILDQLELESYYPDFKNAHPKPREEKTSGT
ncbi:conserved hypothetical protein [Ricinus communis]|uniref:Transmembrane and coiled-coil domain-containing protein n=1 Tax=Ricinus communis TaxID=3988 RepID=B9R834_RICCO|nr:conserved hypothetical protein [Ricinus communis]